MNIIELERVEASENNAFTFRRFSGEHFAHSFHIHPEMEVVYIEQGEGICVAADGSVGYRAGDLFIFHASLPHLFRCSESYHAAHPEECCRSTYIQFVEGILPADYLTMPGCVAIKLLIQAARRGVKFPAHSALLPELEQMSHIDGFERLQALYALLNKMGRRLEQGVQIASESYVVGAKSSEVKYYRIIDYINLHYQEPIALQQVADYVGMNPTSMCRYFKRRAGQSIFAYLLDVRIAIVKEMLATTDEAISNIVYGCGFSSIPNFNTQFKRLCGVTPSEFRERLGR